ncbi:hypothetical protein BCI9360_02053 [Bacillus sp. CECT 9360]|nr:hypothetical protein BCI9360_02053 [Bacillus sp. CECT 9360]
MKELENRPWYEKTWDTVATFTGEVTGLRDLQREWTLSRAENFQQLSAYTAGAMAAAGFIPIVGWACRAFKGGRAIYSTTKGINATSHALDAYRTPKSFSILQQTEMGIYGLVASNGLSEAMTGKDMFGNTLTEEQRQNRLLQALGIGGIAGAARYVDHLQAKNAPFMVDKQKETLDTKGTNGAADDILRNTKCTKSDLHGYLKNIDEKRADEYLKTGNWPGEIQVPKDPSVLKPNGKIDWSQVPHDGFRLDETGYPIKEPYIPKVGEVIDRYGPTEGRFTSPVIDGKPYTYEQRSLPYLEDTSKYHQYKITGDFSKMESYIKNCPNKDLIAAIDGYMKKYSLTFDDIVIQKGDIASGFGTAGGGIQYQLPLPAKLLEDLGLIKILF